MRDSADFTRSQGSTPSPPSSSMSTAGYLLRPAQAWEVQSNNCLKTLYTLDYNRITFPDYMPRRAPPGYCCFCPPCGVGLRRKIGTHSTDIQSKANVFALEQDGLHSGRTRDADCLLCLEFVWEHPMKD